MAPVAGCVNEGPLGPGASGPRSFPSALEVCPGRNGHGVCTRSISRFQPLKCTMYGVPRLVATEMAVCQVSSPSRTRKARRAAEKQTPGANPRRARSPAIRRKAFSGSWPRSFSA